MTYYEYNDLRTRRAAPKQETPAEARRAALAARYRFAHTVRSIERAIMANRTGILVEEG